MESTAAQYEADTGKIDIHVQNVSQDIPVFTEITAEALFEKVRQILNTLCTMRRSAASGA